MTRNTLNLLQTTFQEGSFQDGTLQSVDTENLEGSEGRAGSLQTNKSPACKLRELWFSPGTAILQGTECRHCVHLGSIARPCMEPQGTFHPNTPCQPDTDCTTFESRENSVPTRIYSSKRETSMDYKLSRHLNCRQKRCLSCLLSCSCCKRWRNRKIQEGTACTQSGAQAKKYPEGIS